jgi:hypothetical protein
MIKYEETKIRLYERYIRDVVNDIVRRIDFDKLESQNITFLDKAKTRFGFDNKNGWRFLTSCLDTIGDSQFAIITFLNHKIENGKQFNTGENYLRIYGVLSAVYIQQQATLKLCDLFKTGNLSLLKTDFDKLDISFLRHCISAHPINYDNSGQKVSYKIDRNSINDSGILSIRDQNNSSKEYNIYSCLNIYLKKIENQLELISLKLVSSSYKTSESKVTELKNKLGKIKNYR